jgi:hypothetical protein
VQPFSVPLQRRATLRREQNIREAHILRLATLAKRLRLGMSHINKNRDDKSHEIDRVYIGQTPIARNDGNLLFRSRMGGDFRDEDSELAFEALTTSNPDNTTGKPTLAYYHQYPGFSCAHSMSLGKMLNAPDDEWDDFASEEIQQPVEQSSSTVRPAREMPLLAEEKEDKELATTLPVKKAATQKVTLKEGQEPSLEPEQISRTLFPSDPRTGTTPGYVFQTLKTTSHELLTKYLYLPVRVAVHQYPLKKSGKFQAEIYFNQWIYCFREGNFDFLRGLICNKG